MSISSRRLARLLTQSGVTGPERRPSVNVPAWSCRQLPFLGSFGVPELPRPAVSLWRAVVQGDPAADVTSPCSSGERVNGKQLETKQHSN